MHQIWLEKHRPARLADIVGNRPILSKLQTLAREENILSLILAGPPGCGKTTAVLALCREVLGENFGVATIELNASDERGIDVVREKIKEFAERKVTLPEGQHKVVILDEADSLTEAAQQAMRMIISDFSDTTRFVFSCNDSSRLIEPIQSRCALLRFARLEDADIRDYLLRVAEAEGVRFGDEGLETLVFIADGDMRNAVNNLQAVHTAAGEVSAATVMSVCDVPQLSLVRELFVAAAAGDLNRALGKLEGLWAQNHCPHDIIAYLGRVLEQMDEIDFETKFRFLARVGELKVREAQGLGTKVQLLGTVAELVELSAKSS